MRLSTFRHGYKGGWECNLIGRRWNLRIARYQVALWRDYSLIVGWLA